jgi:5'-deoxynucleotidase YfbR-like HD superfamily hydrolase
MRNKVLKIIELYFKHCKGDMVLRAGNGYCGVYDFNPEQPLDTNFRENDTMHTCHCVYLAMLIMNFFNLGFNEDEKLRAIEFLMVHDLGESKYGDIPDDGRQSGFNKVDMEFIVFLECIKGHPLEDLLKDYFPLFEAYGDEKNRLVRFMKFCDKLDAVLRAFFYEHIGRPGLMTNKDGKFGALTEQDEAGIKATGSIYQADVWGYHLYGKLKQFKHEDEELYNIFCNLIWAAAYTVRGGKDPIPWLPIAPAA